MQFKEKLKENLKNTKTYYFAFLKWVTLGIIMGAVGGLIGAIFAKSISFVTNLRSENGWLLYLLPVGGVLSVIIYKLCRVTDIGTNQVFESVRSKKKVPILLAPAIFAGTLITHMLGGSAGREGAALQLGGSISSLFGKIFKLNEKSQHILTVCGMAALFSALFGTPLGAFVFAIEVVSVGNFCSAAFLPATVSSVTAYFLAHLLGAHAERFNLKAVDEFDMNILWKIVVIAALSAIVSIIFCKLMHFSHEFFKKYIKNEFLRIIVGAGVIIILTLILGTTDYNGGGIDVITRIFETGEVRYEAFILKMIFTAITIGVGFKGGEIVPTFFIGATFGGAVAILIGLNPALGAAVGMAALFCGVTNCPLATIFISFEMFSGEGVIYLALATIISFVISGYVGLYSGQKLMFSKVREEIIDKNAE